MLADTNKCFQVKKHHNLVHNICMFVLKENKSGQVL